MAQVESCLATSRNASRVFSYWKECNSATARLNDAVTCGEQEVENWTEPISSSVSEWWCPSSAQAVQKSRKKLAIRQDRNRINPPKRTSRYPVAKYKPNEHWGSRTYLSVTPSPKTRPIRRMIEEMTYLAEHLSSLRQEIAHLQNMNSHYSS